jgi:hypothetical protein
MNNPSSILRNGLVAFTAVLALAAAGNALAGPGGGGGHGGGGGGGHAAGGGGFHGGGGGYRGGGYGGYRGGYGGRGYYGGRYGGWHGYYGGYGWRGGWGWGCCGFGLGWYLPVLPFGYATYWWGGVPYYYADNNYYIWDGGAGQYEAVEPPQGLTTTPSQSAPAGGVNSPAAGPAGTWTDLFAYPKGGQSLEQQTKDREECHAWAVSQTGFDPVQPPSSDAREAMDKREAYLRAEGACLEARNYSVK